MEVSVQFFPSAMGCLLPRPPFSLHGRIQQQASIAETTAKDDGVGKLGVRLVWLTVSAYLGEP